MQLRIWNEEVMAESKYNLGMFVEVVNISMQKFNQDNCCTDWDLDTPPLTYSFQIYAKVLGMLMTSLTIYYSGTVSWYFHEDINFLMYNFLLLLSITLSYHKDECFPCKWLMLLLCSVMWMCDAKADLCSSSEIILKLQRIFCQVSFAIFS
jgi:hypothetical protein